MPLFTYPTAAEVKDDARLKPEQVNPAYTDSDLTTDISQKISEAAGVVEGRLINAARPLVWPLPDASLATAYPSYDAGQRAEYTARQGRNAALATKLLTLAMLYRSAGQLNSAYTARADQYEARAMMLLEGSPNDPKDGGLAGAIGWVADQAATTNTGDGAVVTLVPTFGDYDECGNEFGGCY